MDFAGCFRVGMAFEICLYNSFVNELGASMAVVERLVGV